MPEWVRNRPLEFKKYLKLPGELVELYTGTGIEGAMFCTFLAPFIQFPVFNPVYSNGRPRGKPNVGFIHPMHIIFRGIPLSSNTLMYV